MYINRYIDIIISIYVMYYNIIKMYVNTFLSASIYAVF